MKDILRKIAGLVVEIPESSPPPQAADSTPVDAAARPQLKTIAEIVKEAPGPNLDEVHVPVKGSAPAEGAPMHVAASVAASGELSAVPVEPGTAPVSLPPVIPQAREDGSLALDYGEIYRRANLPATPFTAEQTLDMIGGLPPDLPMATKRQMVTVMLTTMGRTLGVTQESIVTDAALKLAALSSYAEGMSRQAQDFIVRAEAQITQLEAQVQAYRAQIEGTRAKVGDIQRLCVAEADRLDDVAEFFTLDTGASKHASETGEAPQS